MWIALLWLGCSGDGPMCSDGVTDCGTWDTSATGPASLEASCPTDFSATRVGATSSSTLTILNTGDLDLHVTSISAEAPFEADAKGATISGGSKFQARISFTPTDATSTGWLEIVSDDPDSPFRCLLSADVVLDVDGDGYIGPGGDDCDDEDAAIHPGAPEIWYDGIDEDCDGADDFDQDFDGYESDAYNPDVAAGGGDCQDRKAEIHPGATEVSGDGTDQDCDGAADAR